MKIAFYVLSSFYEYMFSKALVEPAFTSTLNICAESMRACVQILVSIGVKLKMMSLHALLKTLAGFGFYLLSWNIPGDYYSSS